MRPCLRGKRTYMEKEGNKKGRDKLKDKKTNHFHAKLNQLSHLQSRESTSYGTYCCSLNGNRTNCYQQQYESVADLIQIYSLSSL